MTRLAATLALLAATTLPALALPPIAEDARIRETLIAGRVGDVIRKTCPTMRPRFLVALSELNALEDYALAKGYTTADLKALREDDTKTAQMKADADAYLAKAGAVKGEPETYCRVGLVEIAAGSLTGRLLRSTE